MQIVSDQRRSLVYFDETNNHFIKIFKPKFINKLKYFFRLRKYPGDNFFYIAKELQKLEIKTVEIVNFSHYKVVTKNIDGISLSKYLESNSNNEQILQKYVHLISTLLKNNIYSGDLSYDNFFVKDNEIIVIDLEDYRKVKFLARTSKEAIRRMYGKIPEEIITSIVKKLND